MYTRLPQYKKTNASLRYKDYINCTDLYHQNCKEHLFFLLQKNAFEKFAARRIPIDNFALLVSFN